LRRFTALLERIEAVPEGTARGHGSYEHCVTLGQLARCLGSGGQPATAESFLRKALEVIEALLEQQPVNAHYLRQRAALLSDLGDVLTDQGKYTPAQEAYEAALEGTKQVGDPRSQAVVLGQLGFLILEQRDYAEAHARYVEALHTFQALGEPRGEATAWHQLGRVAQEQQAWTEAERCFRESLAIKERLGNAAGAAQTCNMLAVVTAAAGRPGEAEGWYKRALAFYEQMQAGTSDHARALNNLANLLTDEVRAGRAATTRLAEAKRSAEQALAIEETLDASATIWTILEILAQIAELEGRAEKAQSYRRRARETFAAFEGNRYHLDLQHGSLITAIAAAARDDPQAQEAVEAVLPELEARGWKIATATRRIWAGERNWDALAADLDRQDALLILRVLEMLASPGEDSAQPAPETSLASLPVAIRDAVEQGDEAAFAQTIEALSPAEQQAVLRVLEQLQAQTEEEESQQEYAPE
jgi:tetratricopeptide (TPR) repeat protein